MIFLQTGFTMSIVGLSMLIWATLLTNARVVDWRKANTLIGVGWGLIITAFVFTMISVSVILSGVG